jgi:hypothetical protein
MDPKDFAQHIRGKSISRLLHRARQESLRRIAASEGMIGTLRKKPTQRRTGTR